MIKNLFVVVHFFSTQLITCSIEPILFLQKHTVKFLNFWMPENFAIIYLKFKKRGQTYGYFVKKVANGIANSGDPDQTSPLGAV